MSAAYHHALLAATKRDKPFNTATMRDFGTSWVEVPHFGLHAPAVDCTVEFWAYCYRLDATVAFGLNPDNPSNRFLAHAPFQNNEIYWDKGDINAYGRAQWANDTSAAQYTHLALTVLNDQVANDDKRIYKNGIEEARQGRHGVYSPSDVPLYIGYWTYAGHEHYQGFMGEFRVWDHCRTQAEIQADMHTAIRGPRPGLLLCLGLDEQNVQPGGLIRDYSGNNYHGILH